MPLHLHTSQILELAVAWRATNRVAFVLEGPARELLEETLTLARERLFIPLPPEKWDRLSQLREALQKLDAVNAAGCAASAGASLALAALTSQVSSGAESVIISAADAYGFYRGDERRGLSYTHHEEFMKAVASDRKALEGADRVPPEFVFERTLWPAA